jgi:hypothetical protein
MCLAERAFVTANTTKHKRINWYFFSSAMLRERLRI